MTVSVGLILAGGLGRRIGGGKPGILLAGRPLVAHAATRLGAQVETLLLNAPAPVDGVDLPLVPDGIPGFQGPMAGILAGLDWCRARGIDWLVTAPADAPFLPRDLTQRLAAAGGPAVAVTAAADGDVWHPVVGRWPVALADELRADLLAGQRRVRLWAEKIGVVPVRWPEAGADQPPPFFNINTPEDLAAAEIWFGVLNTGLPDPVEPT